MKKNITDTRTVLVVEDELPLLAVIKEKLLKEGMSVITSRSVNQVFSTELRKNAEEGISKSTIELALRHLLDLGRVNAVWLDHNLLGGENGLDFVIKFKANGGHWEKIPIFVVSNTADPELVKKYEETKVHAYYVKAAHTLQSIVGDIKRAVA